MAKRDSAGRPPRMSDVDRLFARRRLGRARAGCRGRRDGAAGRGASTTEPSITTLVMNRISACFRNNRLRLSFAGCWEHSATSQGAWGGRPVDGVGGRSRVMAFEAPGSRGDAALPFRDLRHEASASAGDPDAVVGVRPGDEHRLGRDGVDLRRHGPVACDDGRTHAGTDRRHDRHDEHGSRAGAFHRSDADSEH